MHNPESVLDFAVQADHRVELKECKKKDKYQDLARELKKLWKMKVTSMPILIGALRFGLVSLFNGISTLFRLFNAKAILLEEQ